MALLGDLDLLDEKENEEEMVEEEDMEMKEMGDEERRESRFF